MCLLPICLLAYVLRALLLLFLEFRSSRRISRVAKPHKAHRTAMASNGDYVHISIYTHSYVCVCTCTRRNCLNCWGVSVVRGDTYCVMQHLRALLTERRSLPPSFYYFLACAYAKSVMARTARPCCVLCAVWCSVWHWCRSSSFLTSSFFLSFFSFFAFLEFWLSDSLYLSMLNMEGRPHWCNSHGLSLSFLFIFLMCWFGSPLPPSSLPEWRGVWWLLFPLSMAVQRER